MHVTHDPTRSNIAAPVGRSRPWGLSQLAPFPKQGGDSGHLPYRVHLDPVKQTGVYTDPITHQPIEAGKHGTSKQKASPTAPPGGDGSSAGAPTGQPDSTQDWVQD